jgi:hypothetical protein
MKNDWLFILLENGSVHVERFKQFPITFQWGRDREVPTTYVLEGTMYRSRNIKRHRNLRIYIRKEHNPNPIDMVISDVEIGKLLTVFDRDHTYSENLRFREQKNYMIIFGFLFGLVVGAMIMGIISKVI